MHEMGLAEGILEVVLKAANGEQVKRVSLRVGKLQMVVPDSLEFSFQLVSEGTPAEEALLEMEELPARFRCKRCGAESELHRPPFLCSNCSSSELEVTAGNELLVDTVELENGTVIRQRKVDIDESIEEHIREHHMHDHDHSHK